MATYVYFNNFFPVTHKSCNIHVYSSSSFINSTAVLGLSLLNAAGKVGKGLSSLALSLACLAAELIVRPSLALWTLCALSYLFQSSRVMCVLFHLEIPCKCTKHFVFFFIKVEPFVLFFPRFLKLLCFLDRSCSRHCRCSVTLSIWLSSEETIQTINCQKSTLYFLLDVFEVFVFGNSSFALTLLTLFGKIEIKVIILLFVGVTLLVKRTSGKKTPLVLGNFYSFLTSGRPLSLSTDESKVYLHDID